MDYTFGGKEQLLSARIAYIKEKNSLLEKRHLEVERDRMLAENVGMSVKSGQSRYVTFQQRPADGSYELRGKQKHPLPNSSRRSRRPRGSRAHTISCNTHFNKLELGSPPNFTPPVISTCLGCCCSSAVLMPRFFDPNEPPPSALKLAAKRNRLRLQQDNSEQSNATSRGTISAATINPTSFMMSSNSNPSASTAPMMSVGHSKPNALLPTPSSVNKSNSTLSNGNQTGSIVSTDTWHRGEVITTGTPIEPAVYSSPYMRRGVRGGRRFRPRQHTTECQLTPSARNKTTVAPVPRSRHDSDSGASSSDSHFMDGYIDDTLLDDLDQYVLKIDMDNGFVVYDASVPDPILQRPLRPWSEGNLDQEIKGTSTGDTEALSCEEFKAAVSLSTDENTEEEETTKFNLSSAFRDTTPYLTLAWGCSDASYLNE